MKLITLLAGMVALLVSGEAARIQDSKPAPAPVAAKADVESLDAIVKALYDVISGSAGQERDWNRFHSLFMPKAQLIAAFPKRDGTTKPLVMTPEEYVQRAGPNLTKNGFFEREIARKTESWGAIAQVFSTYESRHAAADEQPFARGINSIQLMKDKDRWYVVSVFWCEENETRPIPAEYLPK
jgi:hypothetical protein